MKMKALLFSIAFVCSLGTLKAQRNETGHDYSNAVGLKFYPTGITFKHFLSEDKALEGLLYFWDKGTRVTGLYEFHFDIGEVEGLKWYVGPGAHIGFYNNNYYGGSTLIGVDGVIGLDYKFSDLPINLSLDWQPAFEFGDGAGFVGAWGGLAVRYVF